MPLFRGFSYKTSIDLGCLGIRLVVVDSWPLFGGGCIDAHREGGEGGEGGGGGPPHVPSQKTLKNCNIKMQ